MLPVREVLWSQELGESLCIGAVPWLAFAFGRHARFMASCCAVCPVHVENRPERTKSAKKRLKEIDLHDVLIVCILIVGCEQRT
jgi:hypothetical protein